MPKSLSCNRAVLPCDEWTSIYSDEVVRVYEEFENALRPALAQHLTLPSIEDYVWRVPERSRAVLQDFLQQLVAELQSPPRLPSIPGYEILEEIGRGGMGVVYRARQLATGRLVAIKLLRAADLDRNRRLRIIWQVEGEVVSRLHHPHVVPIEEFGEHEGEHYLVMPLVTGGDFSEQLGAYSLAAPGLSHSEVRQRQLRIAEWLETVARAVHHVHQCGVLHRDLKPSNILMDGDTPLVCDFGLARRLIESQVLTPPSAAVGTWAYMAPEQLPSGASGRQPLTVAADLWSLGAILYELLTGKPPHLADDPGLGELIRRKQQEEPASPASLNPALGRDNDLEWICRQCLQPEPNERFASAAELASALERFLRRQRVRPRETVRQRMQRWLRPLSKPPVDPGYLDEQRKRVLRIEAATSWIAQAGVFFLTQQHATGIWVWIWFILMDTALGWLIWAPLLRGRRPSPMEKNVRVLWFAADLAVLMLLSLNCPVWQPVETTMMARFYASYAVLRGLIFFIEGHVCWGKLYGTALAFYAGALVMTWLPTFAPLIHGTVYSGWFLWLSCQNWNPPPTRMPVSERG